MATDYSILGWKIPRAEEPGGLQSKGLQRLGHDWVTKHAKKKKSTGFIVALAVFKVVLVSRTRSVLRMWTATPEAEQGLISGSCSFIFPFILSPSVRLSLWLLCPYPVSALLSPSLSPFLLSFLEQKCLFVWNVILLGKLGTLFS